MKVAEMLAALGAGAGSEKVASAPEAPATQPQDMNDEPNVKLAEDLRTAGAMFADGFIDQLLEKKAALAASGSHAGSTPLAGTWGSVAKKLQKTHGPKVQNVDAGHIRADAVYPGVKRQIKS
jgi:hypothetical protein